MKTKTVAIDTLVPDPNNTRLHGARNIEAIKASLTKYGQVEPLIVRQDTKIVIGGNGRLEAMRLLGWK
jgi:ParB-like chromosome segregation protein Spo0J